MLCKEPIKVWLCRYHTTLSQYSEQFSHTWHAVYRNIFRVIPSQLGWLGTVPEKDPIPQNIEQVIRFLNRNILLEMISRQIWVILQYIVNPVPKRYCFLKNFEFCCIILLRYSVAFKHTVDYISEMKLIKFLSLWSEV